MRDITFQNNAGFPINRVEKVSYVRRLLEQEQKETQPEEKADIPAKPTTETVTVLWGLVIPYDKRVGKGIGSLFDRVMRDLLCGIRTNIWAWVFSRLCIFYTDLSNVKIAFKNTEDGLHGIQASVNLLQYRMETYVDGVFL